MVRKIVDITYVCEMCEETFQDEEIATAHETSLPSPIPFEYNKRDRLWLVARSWPIEPVEVDVYRVLRSPRDHKNLYEVSVIKYGEDGELTRKMDKRRLAVNMQLEAKDLTRENPSASFFLKDW